MSGNGSLVVLPTVTSLPETVLVSHAKPQTLMRAAIATAKTVANVYIMRPWQPSTFHFPASRRCIKALHHLIHRLPLSPHCISQTHTHLCQQTSTSTSSISTSLHTSVFYCI